MGFSYKVKTLLTPLKEPKRVQSMFSRLTVGRCKKTVTLALILMLVFWTNGLIPKATAITPAATGNATLTEWSLVDGNSGPWGIAVDPVGNIWFTENASTPRIASFNPVTNTLKEWDIPTGGSNPRFIYVKQVGSSVRVAFTEFNGNKVGYFDNATGFMYEWSLPTSNSQPAGIYVDDNLDMWFTEANHNALGRLTPTTNTLTEFTLPAIPSPAPTTLTPWGIALQRVNTIGAQNLFVWFTELDNSVIGRLEVTSQRLTLFDLASLNFIPGGYQPAGIAVDSGGNVIITNINDQSNRISILRNQTRTVADLNIPTAQAKATSIVWDSARNVAWFTEYRSGKVASVDTITGAPNFQLASSSECTLTGGTSTGVSPCPPTGGYQVSTTSISSPSSNYRTPRTNTISPTTTTIGPQVSGRFSEYPLPTSTAGPNSVALDSGGNVWFTEQTSSGNKIGRMVIVTPFSFGVSASPNTVTVTQGQLANYTVNLSLTSGSTTPVTLSISSALPAGVTASFNPQIGNPTFSASLILGTTTSTPTGTYSLTIVGTGGGVTMTTAVTLAVSAVPPPPSFDFSITPTGATSANITAGETATYGLGLQMVSGSTKSVQLSASGIPAGVTSSFDPSTGSPDFTSTLTLATSIDTTPGTYTILVSAVGGGASHQTSVALKINAPVKDFSISASPNELRIAQASSGQISITIQSIGVFSDPVSLTTSSLPGGMGVSFSPNPVTPTAGGTELSTATVSVSRSVPTGTYTFTVSATSGALVRQFTVTVVVSGCLIATATYGSELSPEVQFLRDFRDYQILHTFAGSNFMYAFNSWYYSFSPTVADYIATHESSRTVMKFILYPLIGVLHISSASYSALAFEPELAALFAGIVASSLIGLVYLALPVSGALWLARRRLNRTTERRIAKCLVGLLLVLSAGFLVSEVLVIPVAMMLVSAATVLTVLAMGSLLPAFEVVEFAKRRL